MLAMPWIFTGFAVFQSFVQTSKGWGPYVIAQSFMSYSMLSVLTLFLSGFLIDKFTSRKLINLYEYSTFIICNSSVLL
jgi:hypothetical protein